MVTHTLCARRNNLAYLFCGAFGPSSCWALLEARDQSAEGCGRRGQSCAREREALTLQRFLLLGPIACSLLSRERARTYMYGPSLRSRKKLPRFGIVISIIYQAKHWFATPPSCARSLLSLQIWFFIHIGKRVWFFVCGSISGAALFTRFTHVTAFGAAASKLPRITLPCIILADMCIHTRGVRIHYFCDVLPSVGLPALLFRLWWEWTVWLPCVMRKWDMRAWDVWELPEITLRNILAATPVMNSWNTKDAVGLTHTQVCKKLYIFLIKWF